MAERKSYPQPPQTTPGKPLNPALREFIRALAFKMADEDYNRQMAESTKASEKISTAESGA